MIASFPSVDDLRRALESRVAEFGNLTGMSTSDIGVRAVNDGAVVERIVGGENFQARTYSRLMDWLDCNWPDPDVIATPQFEVLQAVTPRRIKDLRASVVYKPRGGGRPPKKEREGEWMKNAPRLVIGLPAYALRDWPFEPEQGFVFARGARVARILIAETGALLAISQRRGTGGAFYFGYLPALGEDVRPKEWVPFRRLDPDKEGGAVIEIEAPGWLRAAS